MNKIKNVFTFLCCILLFAGCTKKTDEIFDQSVDERLSEALTNYQKALTGAPGWKLFVYPKGLEDQNIKVGGLTYYVRFTNTNRVTMVSDFATDIAALPQESGYHLKAMQFPSLVFDTYTYMHIPADPDPAVSFSPTGTGGNGWGTDFNFGFTDVAIKDTFRLRGNFNKSEAVLIKATQDEMDAAFARGRLRDIMNLSSSYVSSNPYLYIQANPSLKVGVGFDFDNLFFNVSSLEGGTLVSKSYPCSFTTKGIYLQYPITIGNYTFQEAFWDDTKKVYYITSGGNRVEFMSSSTPVVSISLNNLIGNQYTLISVPLGAGLLNTSPLFFTRYTQMRTGLLTPYSLELDNTNFVFNANTKTMTVNIEVYQFGVGPFICQCNYTYTVDAAGNHKFTKVGQNDNAALVINNINNILGFINSDQFKLDGYSTSSAVLGQFTSVQNPTFYFTGYLR